MTPTHPPWHFLPWLLLLAFVLRAVVALSGDFVIHPDEIMQYLEPAHGLVFGNSVAYWEYYYGARSWLVPYAIAAILFLCKMLGLGEPAFYIPAVKLALCAVSLLIPLALYVLGRRLFGETSGRIALLLGVFWYELAGFAHKPMTEFVATSLFFALMMLALRPQRLTPVQAVVTGIFAVFVVAVRFQYAPLVGLVWLLPFVRGDWLPRLLMIASSLAAVGMVGLFDMLTWGTFLQSYWFNFKVNVALNQVRGDEASAWRYLGWPVLASGGLFLLAVLSAGQDIRRRGFVLLLCLAIVLPHVTQAHREYRFIFAVIPLWLLLCADLLAANWHAVAARAPALRAQWRTCLALCYAVLVSALGITNHLPGQRWVYEAHSRETGYVNFLHGQDEIFAIYRDLAEDESVRGVKDVTRPYFNGGGYYYLHHKAPFYDVSISFPPPNELSAYVSHLIGPPLVHIKQMGADAAGRMLLVTEENGILPLPQYISDAALGKLTYRDGAGRLTIINDFALSHQSENFTVWKVKSPLPVQEWRTYRVYPDNEAMYGLVQAALGEDARETALNFGIEFSDSVEGDGTSGQ